MKVLVLLTLDAANKAIANIIKELIDRGHQVVSYGTSIEDNNTWMIKRLGVCVRPVSELCEDEINKCDFIFCANDTVETVINAEKYIFSFSI